MDQQVIADVGELGWSLELAAHGRWLSQNGNNVKVVTYPERMELHEYANEIQIVMDRGGVKDGTRCEGFDYQRYGVNHPVGSKKFWDKEIFQKYQAGKKRPEAVLLFPRNRDGVYAKRNVPKEFYERISKYKTCAIGRLPDALRIKSASYHHVRFNTCVQDVIDWCESAVCAVGSQSVLPKLSLLQGVPTFIIGHQKIRHTKKDNWMNTKVGWYQAPDDYRNINVKDAVKKCCEWIDGVLGR